MLQIKADNDAATTLVDFDLCQRALRKMKLNKSPGFDIVPLPKDKHGDTKNTDMYRGISLSPVMATLFEYILLERSAYFRSTPVRI